MYIQFPDPLHDPFINHEEDKSMLAIKFLFLFDTAIFIYDTYIFFRLFE